MATDRHQAPSYPLRMPEDLKSRIQEAAQAGGRSLHAELLHRLHGSFHPVTEDDLVPTVVRLERQLARLEIEKALETLSLRGVATTLRLLLDVHNDDEDLGDILCGSPIVAWKELCETYLFQKPPSSEDLAEAFNKLEEANAKLKDMSHEIASPRMAEAQALLALAGREKRAGGAKVSDAPADSVTKRLRKR